MRRNTLFAILGAVAIISGIVVWNAQREPVIRGEPLSWWLGVNRSSASDFKLALKEMDSRCVRFLIREVNRQPKAARGTTQSVLLNFQDLPFSPGEHEDHRREAALILGELGPLARPAIPSLRKLAHPSKRSNSRDEWLEGNAKAALIKLGDESLASYTERFLDPKNLDWRRDWEAIQLFRTNAGLSIPRLAKLFNSSQDPEFRGRFCFPLSFNHSNPELTIPILRSLLDHDERFIRNRAAWALGGFGSDARSALPELIALLQRDPRSRGMISNVMIQIDPDVFSKPEIDSAIRR